LLVATILLVIIYRKRTFHILILTFLVGIFLIWIKQSSLENQFLTSKFNQVVEIQGLVRSDPVLKSGKIFGSNRRADEYSLLIKLTQINDRKINLPARLKYNSNISLQMDQFISAKVRLIKTRERKIAALAVAQESINILSPPRKLFQITEVIRENFRNHTDGSMSDALVPGLVVGDTSLQNNEFKEQMQKVGLSHLTAVSGANFVLVATFLLWILQFLVIKLKHRLIIVSLVLFLFIFLVRPTPSVLRAAVMTLIVLVARYRGESSRAIASLGAAITLLILLDPFQAIDPGFALSVLATTGILFLSPIIEIRFENLLKLKWVAESIAIPVSATILCLPVILLLSNEFSLASIPANILVAPAIAPITVLGFLSAVITPLIPLIGLIFFKTASYFANYIVLISGMMDKFPSIHFNDTRLFILIFILLLALLLQHRQKVALVIAALLLTQIVIVTISWPGRDWQLANCDVGQGDAMVINLGRNSAIVVDTGPDSNAIDRCLRALSIKSIPLLILTHFHSDHVGAIAGVKKNRIIGQVWISNLRQPESSYERVMRELSGINVKSVSKGESYKFPNNEISIEVLWPQANQIYFDQLPGDGSQINNSSISVILRSKYLSLFTGGDIEPEVQELITNSGLLSDIDILKVSHHGSAYQHLPMLDILKPEVAIISVGKENTYGHPDGEFLKELDKRSISVWRTDLSGGISVAPSNKIRVTGKEWWKIRWG
jgi:competence protein ComEC